MAFKDDYDFEYLVNEAENLVIDELEHQLSFDAAAGICKCQDCVLDMAAFALNTVKPYYRVSLLGSVYAQAMATSDEYSESIQQAVKKAIAKVSSNPSHG